MEIPLLNDIVVLFGIGVAVIFICQRLRIPVIVGLLLTGVLAGPHGLGLIQAVDQVELLAEIGVVSLLFTIGMGLSFESVLRIKKPAFVGGSIQVVLTCLTGLFVARVLGLDMGQSLFIGFLLSLSSTTLMLKQFQIRAEVDSPHGRMGLAISIFQDIMTVPMMLLVPVLAGSQNGAAVSPVWIVVKGLGIVVLAIVVGKWLIPLVLFQVVRTRSRELFLLSLITICLGIAGLTYAAGLSLALGAFLAGLMVSESPYTHQAIGDISPFRDVLTSLFFISVGMLLNVRFVTEWPTLILLATAGVLVVKGVIAASAPLLLGYPVRTALLTGLALSQVGEFSFILSRSGLDSNLINETVYQIFLAVTVATMAATPFLINLGPRIADFLIRFTGEPGRPVEPIVPESELADHLIIVGFGVNGRNLAQAAKVAGIPYVILEMNPETVRRERNRGEPIRYGDGSQRLVLEQVGVKNARVLVIAISDPLATRAIARLARDLNPILYIITRTRFVKEVGPLLQLGSDEVIPEEFEASIEIFARVLNKYLIPQDEIDDFIAEIRSHNYEMFRTVKPPAVSLADVRLHLPEIEVIALRVHKSSPAVEKTLAEIDLRKQYGVTLLAIRRHDQVLTNPGGDVVVLADDVVIVLGTPQNIGDAAGLFHSA